MLAIVLGILGFAIMITTNIIYNTDESRLPSASKRRGKQARMLLIPAFVLLALAFLLMVRDGSTDGQIDLSSIIQPLVIATLVVVVFAWFKRKR